MLINMSTLVLSPLLKHFPSSVRLISWRWGAFARPEGRFSWLGLVLVIRVVASGVGARANGQMLGCSFQGGQGANLWLGEVNSIELQFEKKFRF